MNCAATRADVDQTRNSRRASGRSFSGVDGCRMGLSLVLKLDEITPSLERLSDPAVLQRATLAAGTVVGALAQRAFTEPGLRPSAWPARKRSKASHPLLMLSGTLSKSIHVEMEGNDTVKVGVPDETGKYGAVHQFGSSKSSGRGGGIPARPFFPVVEDQLTGNASRMVGDAVRTVLGGQSLG